VGPLSRSGRLASAGIRTSDTSARSLVIIRTKRGAGETGTICVMFNLKGFVQMKYVTG
jgi:hypothetical protein